MTGVKSVLAAARALSAEPIAPGTKGLAGAVGVSALDLVAAGARLFGGQLSYPVLTIRDSAIAHNVRYLADYCAQWQLALAPHVKTAMAPQLFARQLAAGAWGLTVATISQVQVLRRFGVSRILLANQLVDGVAIRWLLDQLTVDDDFDFCCYIDSLAGLAVLTAAVRAARAHQPGGVRRPLDVLIEVGHESGRTGIRTPEGALALAREATATAGIRLRGLAGYEGDLPTPQAAQAFCDQLRMLFDDIRAAGLLDDAGTEAVLTAGGSAYPQVIAQRLSGAAATVVLRSGSYLTHDEGLYARVSPFTGPGGLRPALELWTQVLARPEPGLALLLAGRRDIGMDQGLPAPRRVRRGELTAAADPAWTISALNDQHAYLRVPDDAELAAGDLVSLAISHPCTTLDRWSHAILLDDDDRVLDVIRTFF